MISYKNKEKSYPTIGLSRQKVDEAQYQQQDFLLTGTDIDFVVIN